MTEVEDFIYRYEDSQREVMLFLHQYLVNEIGLRTKLSYGIPFYYNKSWICYLSPTKNETIEFAFPRGNELSNEQGLLQANGRKQVMGIEFYSKSEISLESMNEIIQEAILLDETVRYKSKRSVAK